MAPTPAADRSDDLDYRADVAMTSPPEAVYEALTTLTGLAGWWSTVTGDGRQGGELRFVFAGDEPLVLRVDEARPSSLVRWTCVSYGTLPEWAGTTITFNLSSRPEGGCDLAFRHRGLTPRLECWHDCRNGWDHFLPSLRDWVDTGEGRPWASPADLARREARRLRRLAATPE